VAVATTASAALAALHGVAAEMGEEGLEKGVAWVVGLCLLYHWREGPRLPREDKGGRARCLGRHILGPNLGQGWVESDASVWLRRTAGHATTDSRSGQTSLDVHGRFVSPAAFPLMLTSSLAAPSKLTAYVSSHDLA
jgi:hypothetical protein